VPQSRYAVAQGCAAAYESVGDLLQRGGQVPRRLGVVLRGLALGGDPRGADDQPVMAAKSTASCHEVSSGWVGSSGAGLPVEISHPLLTSFCATAAAITAEPVPSTFQTIEPMPNLLATRPRTGQDDSRTPAPAPAR